MRHRQDKVREKGFSLTTSHTTGINAATATGGSSLDVPLDFSKFRVGVKSIEDAVLIDNSYQKINRNFGNKEYILKALHTHNYKTLREVSNFYFETSGIYSRLCKYIAHLYRFDWMVVPYINDTNSANQAKVLKEFNALLKYLDASQISRMCGDIALKVVRNGCYYGYVADSSEAVTLQELPAEYCRSRFEINGFPTVEFNMKYFDDCFMDVQYRLKVLKMFPSDFGKGYLLYKQNKLPAQYQGDSSGWYLLDPDRSVKFNNGGSDFPTLVNAIPAIIDLDEAQALDRKKTMQKLLKILIQKLPIDKNGDLIFDIDEAADLHNNAVTMLKRAIGVDVLTTFADIDVADMSDSNTTTSTDDLAKVERTVYNEFGVSHNLFNSDSNLALTNSILDDEASIRSMPQQFQAFFNKITLKASTNPKKYTFGFKMLETTIYNYQNLSKLYKDQTQIGYSKMLPQIALGHSQSEILATINFENNFLNLTEIMIPPLMSSTMSSETVLGNKTESSSSKTQKNTEGKTEKQAGRPEKSDSEKSDKTIANSESK